ncbi:MAG: dienelactone hydrolase family protein [Chitinophagaceae bacterium]
MKTSNIFHAMLPALLLCLAACNNTEKKAEPETAAEPKLKEENITYTGDSVTMKGYVVYDENKKGQRPAVLVVPEWWGLNEYAKRRARELAALGYIAMAVDMYGNGEQADNPAKAQELATPFYTNPQKGKTRLDAALAQIKTYSQTDTARIAAIGYCFGGTQVLNAAKLGDNLKGVVSLHGGLQGPQPDKNLLKAAILVCHGGADSFVPQAQVDQFKKQMDSIGANYAFKVYEGATHAFTNPDATETGKKFNMPIAYNAAADTASWNDMKAFLDKTLR